MKVNQLKSGVILSYISEGCSILIGLLYTPIMLRLLGQSEYGLYQLCSSVISYLGLLNLGLGSSYIRFYSRSYVNEGAEGVKRINGMFLSIFSVIGFIAVLCGCVLVSNVDLFFENSLTASELSTAKILMSLMVFNMAVSFPGGVFGSYIIAKEKYIFQRTIGILKNICSPFLTLPLLLMGYKSVAVVVIQTVLTVAYIAVNAFYAIKKLGMRWTFKRMDFRLLKEMFAFSVWILLDEIISQLNWNVDKFVLGVYSGTATVAIYGVASHLHMLYMNFSTPISNVFAPKINRIVAEEKAGKVLNELFIKVGRIQFVLMFLIISGLTVFGKFFINLWAGEGYSEAYYVALLLCIPVTIPLIQNIGIEIQRAKNMHQFRSKAYFVFAVLNVVLTIPLAKNYGGFGAAIGTAISMIFGNGLVMNIYYHKKIGINIIKFWKEIFKFVPAVIVPCVLGFIIMRYVTFSNVFVFVLWMGVYSLVYGASMWLLGLNKDEKQLIIKPIKKLLERIKKV